MDENLGVGTDEDLGEGWMSILGGGGGWKRTGG